MVKYSRTRRQRTQTSRYSDDNPSTFTHKEKNKEGYGNSEESIPQAKKRQRPRESSQPQHFPSQPETQHCPPPPEPQHTCLSHHVRIPTLFSSPVVNSQEHSVVFGRGLGIPPALKAPEWEYVPLDRCYFPEDVDEKTGVYSAAARKISRSCTCLSLDETDTYLAIGDTAGFVSIYLIIPKFICISRLSTSASKREHASELKLPPSKKYRSYEKRTHLNQITQISFAGEMTAVSTIQEIELLDIKKNQIIWSFQIHLPVHNLSMQPSTQQVLCSCVSNAKTDFISPLWSLSYNKRDVSDTIYAERVFVEPTLDDCTITLGHRCTAIWDKSDLSRILMVTLVHQQNEDARQDLLRLENTSFRVLQRTTIPNKPAGKSSHQTVEFLSQSPSGHLTLVSSTRGIRLIETSSFSLLRVFGEAVTLHGNSLVFQQCCFIPKSSIGNEMDCLLTARENEVIHSDKYWTKNQCSWILGVPHAWREPQEMKDTLHIWNFANGKRTSSTILAPPKGNGFRSVIYVKGKLIIATQTGDCYSMAPKISSDFPGIMYPPGYHVIDDNLEYIEDEDGLDHEVKVTESIIEQEDDTGENYFVDVEMEKVMKLSMEQRMNHVDVVSIDNEKASTLAFLPCHPEFHLKQNFHDGGAASTAHLTKSIHSSFTNFILEKMPNTKHALNAQEEAKSITDEPKSITTKPTRNKRSKAATLEALLKSSLKPELRKIMISRQQWRFGENSSWVDKKARKSGITCSNNSQDSEATVIHHKELVHRSLDKEVGLPSSGIDNIPVISSSEGSNPCGTPDTTTSTERTEPGLEDAAAESNYIGGRNQSLCLKSTEGRRMSQGMMDAATALLLSATGELESPRNESTLNHNLDRNAEKTINNPFSKETNNNKEPAVQNTEKEIVITLSRPQEDCRACRGRWVVHTCGKRAKPVDYDALLRVAKEKREKEEEEKKKVKAEKRRLADAKRREARKKKKLEEEERARQQEMERIRQEKEDREKQLERSRMKNDDKERRRADMLQRLQAEQAGSSASSPVDWPPPIQSYNTTKNEAVYQQPKNETAYQQTENTISYQQSKNEYTSYQHPGNEVTYQYPENENVYPPPENEVTYRDPENENVYPPPENEATYQHPENENVYPQPENKVIYQHPENENVYPQPENEVTYQAYENPHNHLPPKDQIHNEDKQSSTLTAEWPPLASSNYIQKHTVKNERFPSSIYQGNGWPQTFQNYNQETSIKSENESIEDTRWNVRTKEVSQIHAARNEMRSPYAESEISDSNNTFQQSSSTHLQHIDTSSETEHIITSETLDPAQALASLASFASAAPKANLSTEPQAQHERYSVFEMQQKVGDSGNGCVVEGQFSSNVPNYQQHYTQTTYYNDEKGGVADSRSNEKMWEN